MPEADRARVVQLVSLYLLRDRAEAMGMPRTKAGLCDLIDDLRAAGRDPNRERHSVP